MTMKRVPSCTIQALSDPSVLRSVSYHGPRGAGMKLAKSLRESGFRAFFVSFPLSEDHRYLETDAPLPVLQVRVLSFFANFECKEPAGEGYWRVSNADGRVRYVPFGKAC